MELKMDWYNAQAQDQSYAGGSGVDQGAGGDAYVDNSDYNSRQSRKLFVGGLNYETDESGLQAYFGQWGEVVDSVVIRDPTTKRSRGFGFVTYREVSMVEAAQRSRPHRIDNRVVETKLAVPKDENIAGNGAGGDQATNDDDSIKQYRKLFVGGLNYQTDETSLLSYFSQWGDVVDAVVLRDPNTKRSRGFGFVTYSDMSMVEEAQRNRPHKIDNRVVETKLALTKDELGSEKDNTGGGGRSADDDPNEKLWRKLFVGGLSYETDELSLRNYFSQWGELVDAVVLRDPNTQRSRGFGFITYRETSMVEDAQQNRPHKIDNRVVETKRALPKDPDGTSNNQSVTKMFVGGLKEDTTEDMVRETFGQFGEIENIDIVKEQSTGKCRGFAFVVFSDYDSVDKAVLVKWHELNSRKVEVKKALTKEQLKIKEASVGNKGGKGGSGAGQNWLGSTGRGNGGSGGGMVQNFGSNMNGFPAQNQGLFGGIPWLGGNNMPSAGFGAQNFGGFNMGTPNMSANMGGPNMGGNMGVPNMGGNMGVPNMGGNMGGPNMGFNMGGPNMGGPNMGGNMGGPNMGMNMGVPNMGMNMGGPNMGMNMGGPNMGMNMGGPNMGSNFGTPNAGSPNVKGGLLGSKFAGGSNTGSNFGNPGFGGTNAGLNWGQGMGSNMGGGPNRQNSGGGPIKGSGYSSHGQGPYGGGYGITGTGVNRGGGARR